MKNYTDLKNDVRDEVKERFNELLESECPDDTLYEMVDGWIPVYTNDLLEYAQSELWLAVNEPEIYGFDGTHTPVNAITGNMYSDLLEVATEEFETLKEAINEAQEVK